MAGNMVKVMLVTGLLFSPFCACCASVELVPIASGTLVVYDRDGRERNAIQIDSFLASKFETTHGLWNAFAGEMGDKLPDIVTLQSGDDLKDVSPGLRNPMVGVTWYEAVVFCNWLSLRDGLQPVYGYDNQRLRTNLRKEADFPVTWNRSATGYRLPTSAEWLFMATNRSKSRTKYAGSNRVSDVAIWGKDQFKTAPVGTKRPNRLGIYDLSGNAAEWCWDFWQEDYLHTAPDHSPAGPSAGIWDKSMKGSSLDGEYMVAHVVAGGDIIGVSDITLQKAFWPFPAASRLIVGIRLVRNAK